MKQLYAGLFLLLSISHQVCGQNQWNFLIGLDFSGNHFHYEQDKHVLIKQSLGQGLILFNPNVSFQYRPSKQFSIEAGFQLLEYANMCYDTSFVQRNPSQASALQGTNDDLGPLGFDTYYSSYYLTATRHFVLLPSTSFYVSGGFSRNFLQGNGTSMQSAYTYAANNEVLTSNVHAVSDYWGLVLESGFNFTMWQGRVPFYIGCRYNSAFSAIISTDFTDVANGTLVETDHISTNGSYIGMVTRIGINVNPNVYGGNIQTPKFHRKPSNSAKKYDLGTTSKKARKTAKANIREWSKKKHIKKEHVKTKHIKKKHIKKKHIKKKKLKPILNEKKV